MSTPTPLLALDAARLAMARSWAALAAALGVAAEHARDGGTAAALEHQAARCRARVMQAVGDGLDQPGVPLAAWDVERRRMAGQILRDAYTTARKGGPS